MAKSKRILVGKALRQSQQNVTSEQVTQAIRAFQDKGGLIKQLPPEPAESRSNVGNAWESAYEKVLDY